MVSLPVAIVHFALFSAALSTSVPRCFSQQLLGAYGFSSIAPFVSQTGVCTPFYSNNGTCVTPEATQSYLNSMQVWTTAQSVNAYRFTVMFKKVFVFWSVVQGYVSEPNLNSVIKSNIPFVLDAMVAKYYTEANTWVQSIQLKGTQAIDPCFQAIANITNGIYCGITSNNTFDLNAASPSYPNSIPVTLQANATYVGSALQVCLPLIDVYCSVTYGVSISTNELPFNFTYNWTDGGVSLADCQRLQANLACNKSSCNDDTNNYLTSNFATNWIRFVPSAHAQQAMNEHLMYFNNETVFAPIASRPAGIGVGLVAGQSGMQEDFYSSGVYSGQSATRYLGSHWRLAIGLFTVALPIVN